jgi:hypothetical protein
MTEADVESIWDTTWDTTRFGKINVRIGELLNFLVHGDATTDVTFRTNIRRDIVRVSKLS